MKTQLFDYELPDALIARRPPAARDGGRLLVVGSDGVEHRQFRDWAELVEPGSLVVLNDTRVMKARLVGRRLPGGGKVEILLLQREDAARGTGQRWSAVGRANSPLRAGTRIEAGSLTLEVIDQHTNGVLSVSVDAEEGVDRALELHGHVPIPPYLEREDDALDTERYQTVFADCHGSAAAPTAGLHLTQASLERLRSRGIEVAKLTLHVGLATFRPVSAADLDEHVMHAERFAVSVALAERVEAARRRGAPVVAVGTTVVRALESARDPGRPGVIRATSGETRLLIQPGYVFGVVDALLTNFHQPKSTLLALVAALVGRERLLDAYRSAIAESYRFLSYGDAMWIPRRLG
jgi:S-adenosylmethionine:tRNA ribosyltransferase-isomerase